MSFFLFRGHSVEDFLIQEHKWQFSYSLVIVWNIYLFVFYIQEAQHGPFYTLGTVWPFFFINGLSVGFSYLGCI